MKLEDILKAQGLTDEQIEAVKKSMKENNIFTSSEENIDIRYSKLKGQHDDQTAELEKANQLIDQLQKNKGNKEDIEKYQEEIKKLKEEALETKKKSNLELLLLKAGAKKDDIDYLSFKAGKMEDLKYDENGEIKNADDFVKSLKTTYSANFEGNSDGENGKNIQEHKLGDDGKKTSTDTITKEQFAKMSYKERLDLFNNDPDTYRELRK